MSARRSGLCINGWLIVDKPTGRTSASVVGTVRRLTKAAKVGHGGTLDPLATGVLPIALGEATKTVAYVMDGPKRYRFTIRWGEQRDTDDAEGAVVATSDVRPDAATVDACLARFEGAIDQVPPTYSAVKVAGRRAYALARADQPPKLAPRQVIVHQFSLVAMPDVDHAEFEVRAGKGVYMRALARDLARACGSVGHVSALRRLAVGPFDESRAISLETLASLGHSDELAEHLRPLSEALADIPALDLTEAEAKRLQRGRPVAVMPVARRSPLDPLARDALDTEAVICATSCGKPVALAQVRGGEIRPVRVLNL